MVATVAPSVYLPSGPTLVCPYCGQVETAAPRGDGAIYWRAFRPQAILGNYQDQLHRVFSCLHCYKHFAPVSAPAPATRAAGRAPQAALHTGMTLTCPKCGQWEERAGPRARWELFVAMPPPPALAEELANCYRCCDCGHTFAPRVARAGEG